MKNEKSKKKRKKRGKNQVHCSDKQKNCMLSFAVASLVVVFGGDGVAAAAAAAPASPAMHFRRR